MQAPSRRGHRRAPHRPHYTAHPCRWHQHGRIVSSNAVQVNNMKWGCPCPRHTEVEVCPSEQGCHLTLLHGEGAWGPGPPCCRTPPAVLTTGGARPACRAQVLKRDPVHRGDAVGAQRVHAPARGCQGCGRGQGALHAHRRHAPAYFLGLCQGLMHPFARVQDRCGCKAYQGARQAHSTSTATSSFTTEVSWYY